MKIKYKLLAFIPLFVMNGCVKVHKVVVKEKTETKILVTDVESNTEKIFVLKNNYDWLDYIKSGDTITCLVDKIQDNHRYKTAKVVNVNGQHKVWLTANQDTIHARKQAILFESAKREINSIQK